MSTYEDRLNALRAQLKADRLDGFVVPLLSHMSAPMRSASPG